MMLDQDQKNHITNVMVSAACEWERAASDVRAAHVLMRPRLFIDGDQWCALYGEDLMSGLAAFGSSPAEAMAAFDKAWVEKLAPKEPAR